MRTTDINLIEMGNTAITGGDCDVFELDVHVVFGCLRKRVSQWSIGFGAGEAGSNGGIERVLTHLLGVSRDRFGRM
jgi:hypothetical protein